MSIASVSGGRTREVSRKRLPLGSRFCPRDGGWWPPFRCRTTPDDPRVWGQDYGRSTVPRNSGTLKFGNKSNHLRERSGPPVRLAPERASKRAAFRPLGKG